MSKIIVLVLFSLSFFSCKSNKSSRCAESDKRTDYKKVIEILTFFKEYYEDNEYYRETGRVEFIRNLPEKDSFRILFENPCIYKKSLMRVLADGNQHKLTKYIGLHALFKLCIDDYLEVLELVYYEHKKGKMDCEMLKIALYQDEFSLEVIKNYKNLKLRKLLQNIQKDFKKQGLSNDAIYIDEILSGKAWNESIDFYTSGATDYIPWYCGSRFY